MKHIKRDTVIINNDCPGKPLLYPCSVIVTLGEQSARVPAQISQDGCISAFGLMATVSSGGKTKQIPAVIYEWEDTDGLVTESAAFGTNLMPASLAPLQFDKELMH